MGEINPDKIIRRFESGAILLKCSFCEGKAAWPPTDLEDGTAEPHVCPVCKGKSVVHFKSDFYNLMSCEMCNSTGRKWEEGGHFFGATCDVCGGTGYIDLSEGTFEVESTEKHFWALIDSRLKAVSHEKFMSGFYADAVESAFKEINFLFREPLEMAILDALCPR